jgi:hypothetical protein
MLASDVRVVTDGGGKIRAALEVIEGAERVARFLVDATRPRPGQWWREDFTVRFATINGLPGMVVSAPEVGEMSPHLCQRQEMATLPEPLICTRPPLTVCVPLYVPFGSSLSTVLTITTLNLDVPPIEILFNDIPDPHTPLGAHGIGELGITGVAASIANAVYHATGKRIRELPITLDKLL